MTGMDRFAAWLRREAVSYNRPPAAPARAMWAGVERRLRPADTGPDAEAPGGADGAGGPVAGALAYHASPPAPREEMWTRIEAAWALRRSAVAAHEGVTRGRAVWSGRRGAVGWAAGLAAAGLVLGIALGRGTRPGPPGETAATGAGAAPAEAAAPTGPSAAGDAHEPEALDDAAEPIRTAEPGGRAAAGDEAETPILLAADARPDPPATPRDAPGPGVERTAALQGPGPQGLATGRPLRAGPYPEPEFDHVTARHLGRAEALLTAFRTDRRTPASQADLARWARGLLAETRMFLGLSYDAGSPVQHSLFEDLELVLIQIAGLGPGAPDFEWELARESMERRGTLMRLRAASAEGET